MTLDTSFSLFGIGFDIDPLTGITVNTGLVGVGVAPTGSTTIDFLDDDVVGVDLTTGTSVDVLGSEVAVDLTEGVEVDVADELVGVDVAGEIALVEVAGIPVEIDLTQGILFGVGEELLFADLTEQVAIATELIADSIELPTDLDI